MKRPINGPVIRGGDVWDLCDCKAMPMMAWHFDDKWTAMYGIDDGRDINADAKEYKARNADAWMIGCPQCGRVYARGFNDG